MAKRPKAPPSPWRYLVIGPEDRDCGHEHRGYGGADRCLQLRRLELAREGRRTDRVVLPVDRAGRPFVEARAEPAKPQSAALLAMLLDAVLRRD